jgi:hypothetical protein
MGKGRPGAWNIAEWCTEAAGGSAAVIITGLLLALAGVS